MQGFKSAASAQRFVSVHAAVYNRVPPSAASVLRLITPGTTRPLWLNRYQTANKLRPTRVNVSKPEECRKRNQLTREAS